ncbi:Zinc finger CCCH domain-containing protein 17 [Linum grandiflorum]
MLGRLPGDGGSAVSGLCVASGVSKLYGGSIDGVVKAWDSNNGQASGSINIGGKIGCMHADGDWIYVGLESMVKVGNIHSGAVHTLAGPVGQVHALHVGYTEHLFAAAQDGTIWAWKTSADEQGNIFQPVASMTGHTNAVISLRSGGGNKVYSGSIDGTIKVWDVKTWQCTETFKGHDDAVTSLLCYDQFLLSCSLDKKIKVWATSPGEERRLEVIYTHEEAHAALALCGIGGIELCGKSVLLCSWNNESVGVYELPSFIEKGRIYSKGEVRGLGVGSKGMFFTGDASGVVTAWNMEEEVAEDGSSRQKKRRKMEQ